MMRGRQFIPWFLRVLLGGVFLWAGIVKALTPLDFARSVAAYDLLPPSANLLVAVMLPWVELVTGACLFFPRLERAAALVAAVLNLIFVVAIASVLLRGLNVDCGCFGHDGALSPGWALLRDLLLLAISLWLVLRPAASAARL